VPPDSENKVGVDSSAVDFEQLLDLAEKLRSTYRRAFAWHFALITFAATIALVGLGYLESLRASGAGQMPRDPLMMAVATVVALVTVGLVYVAIQFRLQAVRDRRTFFETVQILHEFVEIANSHWSELHQLLIRVRLSRLEIG
jgi:hypothetical protein